MRVRRITLMILIFSLIGAGTIFADSVYEKFNAKRITVQLNGNTIENPGLVVDFGKDSLSMVPLREVAQSLGGIISYDEAAGTVNIVKPNVQLSMHTVLEDVSLSEPFGVIPKGKYSKLAFLAQVDNLTAPMTALRVTVVDPFGAEIEKIDKTLTQHQENFWLRLLPLELNFRYTGDYKVNFFMKSGPDSEFVRVSQLTIKSIQAK